MNVEYVLIIIQSIPKLYIKENYGSIKYSKKQNISMLKVKGFNIEDTDKLNVDDINETEFS